MFTFLTVNDICSIQIHLDAPVKLFPSKEHIFYNELIKRIVTFSFHYQKVKSGCDNGGGWGEGGIMHSFSMLFSFEMHKIQKIRKIKSGPQHKEHIHKMTHTEDEWAFLIRHAYILVSSPALLLFHQIFSEW